MTREELFDVLSLNFEQMWYRIWLTTQNKDLMLKKQSKFMTSFMSDNGFSLKNFIMQLQPIGMLSWEIPKGKKNNSRESDINCAIREVYEETSMRKTEYRILPHISRTTCITSNGTKYTSIYYVAICKYKILSGIKIGGIKSYAEVDDVRWHDIEGIRQLNCAVLGDTIAPVFNYVKLYFKGFKNSMCIVSH
jgi:ADP-ribose pyrophosphatase YjhB (NUDIX family)